MPLYLRIDYIKQCALDTGHVSLKVFDSSYSHSPDAPKSNIRRGYLETDLSLFLTDCTTRLGIKYYDNFFMAHRTFTNFDSATSVYLPIPIPISDPELSFDAVCELIQGIKAQTVERSYSYRSNNCVTYLCEILHELGFDNMYVDADCGGSMLRACCCFFQQRQEPHTPLELFRWGQSQVLLEPSELLEKIRSEQEPAANIYVRNNRASDSQRKASDHPGTALLSSPGNSQSG